MSVMTLAYYCSFTLFLAGNCAAATTATSELIPAFKLGCQLIAIAFLLLKLVFDRFGTKQMALFVPISLVFAYSGHVSSDYSLLWGWLFIVTGSGAKLSDLARIALVVFGASLLITVGLALTGVIRNLVLYRDDISYHALGFTHINSLGLRFYELAIALMLLRYPRYGVFDSLYCIAAFVLIYILTGSRTSMLCVLAIFAMILLVRSGFVFRHEKGLLWAFEVFFVLEVLISLGFLFADPAVGGFIGAIDDLLSGRIYLAHYYFVNYGISLFGNNFDGILSLASGGYYFQGVVIDNAYCHAILVNGLAPYLIMVGLIFQCYRSMRKEGRFTPLAMAMALFSFIGVSEASALNFYTAYALLAITPMYFGDPILDKGEE